MNMKAKKIILSLLFLILFSAAAAGLLWFCLSRLSSSQPAAEEKEITLEAGTAFACTSDVVLDDSSRISDFSCSSTIDPNIPGTYQIPYSYKEDGTSVSGELTLIIEDTTPPVYTGPQVLEVYTSQDEIRWDDLIEFEDIGNVSVEIDADQVNLSEPGTYILTALASDAQNNKNTVQIEVKVLEAAPISEGGPVYYGSIAVANKKHGMAADYAPGEDPEAAQAAAAIIADMQAQGYDISSSYSGFRSYAYQSQLYNGYVSAYGQAEADRISARPGFSEHQTGLAFDLKHSDGSLVTRNPEAQWLADHAHEYGFIIRYPEGKEEITGYSYEPWHLRYIGKEAESIYESGLTLEEYLSIEGGMSYAEDNVQ